MVYTLPVGPLGTNCYIYVYTPGSAVIVDPGCNWKEIAALTLEKELRVDAIIYTHGHWDHVLGARKLREALMQQGNHPKTVVQHQSTDSAHNTDNTQKLPVIAHVKERPLFSPERVATMVATMQRWGAYPIYTAQSIDPHNPLPPTQEVAEGDTITGGLQVIHTPGHTEGSTCLYQKEEGILFTGDTIFKDARGRTDFEGGSDRAMIQSIKKIYTLPEQTIIYPGHGESTTVGVEKRNYPL